MKTRDAFAFRSFDPARILQRRFFAEFGFGAEMTDKEIFQAFNYETIIRLEDNELFCNAEKLSDLLFAIDGYLNRIDCHCRRLERYIHAAAGVIADGDIADVESMRSRYKRGQKLHSTYAAIRFEVKILRDNTDKIFKVVDSEAQHAYRKNFADRLKFARQKMKMTQKELAEKLGLSQNGYSPYETGQRNPSIPMMIRLSKLLNCSTDWLLGQTAW